MNPGEEPSPSARQDLPFDEVYRRLRDVARRERRRQHQGEQTRHRGFFGWIVLPDCTRMVSAASFACETSPWPTA